MIFTGRLTGETWAAWRAILNAIIDRSRKDLPEGSQLIVRGQIQTMKASYIGLLSGLAFSILLVYLLIVVNFQSWLDPFIILMALPAALAGIVWFLFMTENHNERAALTGAIMCMGVATANSILVVSFSKERLEAGKTPSEAALEAGYTRFRPVLMTALAMIIGMLPMSLGHGRRRRAERTPRPRRDRRAAVCNRGDAFLCARILQFYARDWPETFSIVLNSLKIRARFPVRTVPKVSVPFLWRKIPISDTASAVGPALEADFPDNDRIIFADRSQDLFLGAKYDTLDGFLLCAESPKQFVGLARPKGEYHRLHFRTPTPFRPV